MHYHKWEEIIAFVWRTTNGGSEDELPSRSPIELRDNTNAPNPDTHKIGIPAVQPQQHIITGPKKKKKIQI
jgi:hypothetical protein